MKNLEQWLIVKLSETFCVVAEEIDIRRPFSAYGMDSTMAVALVNDLEDFCQLVLPATLFWDCPTIEKVCQKIARLQNGNGEISMDHQAAAVSFQENKQGAAEAMAVIGIGCRLPGAVNTEQFWSLLSEGCSTIADSPAFPCRGTNKGSYLEAVEYFDAGFFDISDYEAASMDPQQRHLLEVTIEALHDAGIPLENIRDKNVGVFAGVSAGDYAWRRLTRSDLNIFMVTGNVTSVAANRISYFLGLRGPSLAVDTACSSSAVAMHLAFQSLSQQECQLAIVCGANLALEPDLTEALMKAGMLSPEGQCKTFDAQANGYVRGEGIISLVLKPLPQAIRDQDQIYATVLGTAVNHNGESNGLTAPNQAAQEAVIRAACKRAGVDPSDLDYVELHGTATALGDPIEAKALANVMQNRPAESACWVGSVKTNIGHLEAAAGLAGITKVCLAIHSRQLPASLNFEKINPHIDIERMKLLLNTCFEKWPYDDSGKNKRLAGVSSFGFGGTNAHVVLSSAPDEVNTKALPSEVDGVPLVFIFSSHDRVLLKEVLTQHHELLNTTEISFTALAYNLCFRCSHFTYRVAIVSDSMADLKQKISCFIDDKNNPWVTHAASLKVKPKIAFVYSGQGNQWKAMAQSLVKMNDVFRSTIQACDLELQSWIDWSVLDFLDAGVAETALTDVAQMQMVICCIQIALTAVLQSYGIEPEAVVGHSMGEIAAAVAAGKIALNQAMEILYWRATLQQQSGLVGHMAMVQASAEDLTALINAHQLKIAIAAYNMPGWNVISGLEQYYQAAIEILNEKKWVYRQIPGNFPFHGEWLQPIGQTLACKLDWSEYQQGHTTYYSTVTGKLCAQALDGAYWAENMVRPVQFEPAIKEMLNDGYTLFIELGPDKVLSTLIKGIADQQTAKSSVILLNTLAKGKPDSDQLLLLLARLSNLGLPVYWQKLFSEKIPHLRLPTMVWNHKPYWLDVDIRAVSLPDSVQQAHPCNTEPLQQANVEVAAELSPLEKTKALWKNILHVQQIADDDNFIELGGNSLMATQLAIRIKDLFNVDLSVRDIFDHLVFKDFYRLIAQAFAAASGNISYSMSHAQKSLWLHQQMASNKIFYNNPIVLYLEGNVKTQYVEKALNEIVLRHDSLRTTFFQEGKLFYQVVQPFKPFSLSLVDLTALGAVSHSALKVLIDRDIKAPFDLAVGPLFRFKIIQYDVQKYALLLNLHHIISDGWSWKVFIEEFFMLYDSLHAKTTALLPALSLQYPMYSKLEEEYLHSEEYTKSFNYWRDYLDNMPLLKLSVQGQRDATITYNGSKIKICFPQQLFEAVEKAAHHYQVSTFVYLLSVFQLLIYHLSRQTDFGVGIPIASRDSAELEKLIGFFVNSVVNRVNLNPDHTFADHIIAVRNNFLDNYAHHRVPFEKLVEILKFEREPGYSPLFQVMFVLQDNRFPEVIADDVSVKLEVPDNGTALYDLLLEVFQTKSDQYLSLRYNKNLFSEDFVTHFLENYLLFLKFTLQHPEQLLSDFALTETIQKSLALSIAAVQPAQITHYLAPSSIMELKLANIWSELLQIEKISVEDHFIKLGGNSIQAVSLLMRIEEELSVKVSLGDFFQHSTVRGLANFLESHAQGSDIQKAEFTVMPVAEKKLLSYSQQRLWFLNILQPGTTHYNLGGYLRLQGHCRVEALTASINAILMRHDILRLRVDKLNGQPEVGIHAFTPIQLPVIQDYQGVSEEILKTVMLQEIARPFDFLNGPLYRFLLLKRNEEQHYLFISIHHIVFDGWSIALFLQELGEYYHQFTQNGNIHWEPLKRQYLDYAYWQRNILTDAITGQLAYWKQYLKKLSNLDLPTDYLRPKLPSYEGRKIKVLLQNTLHQRLKQVSQEKQVTLFSLLLSAFFILLYDISQQKDFAVGIPYAGRNHFLLDPIIGFFINTLVVRCPFRESYEEFLQAIFHDLQMAQQHSEVPFEKLIEELQLQRDLSFNPLVQVLFNYINIPQKPIELPGLSTDLVSLNEAGAKVDLNMMVTHHESGGLWCELEYSIDLFSENTIQKLLEEFVDILNVIANTAPTATRQLLKRESLSAPPVLHYGHSVEQHSITQKFAAMVQNHPDAIALVVNQQSWTYGQLDAMTTQFACGLLAKVAKQSGHIVLILPHHTHAIIGILAVLKAGFAYVPVNADQPVEWVKTVAEDVQADAVLHDQATADWETQLPGRLQVISFNQLAQVQKTCALPFVSPEQVAYILYTSGSTGKPKGVMQSHRNVCHHINNYIQSIHMTQKDGLPLLARYSFDAAVMDIYAVLFSGAKLYFVDLRQDGISVLKNYLSSEQLSVLHVTPSVFRIIAKQVPLEKLHKIRAVIWGGEDTRCSDLELFAEKFSSNCLLINGLGPTECTLALQCRIDSSKVLNVKAHLPVGYPVPGVDVLLIDEQGAPTDFMGEMIFSSPYIALGYWQQPDLTSKVFFYDQKGRYCYKTGDLAKKLSNGMFEFLGRKDTQVKIRGHRVDLGHIEATLLKYAEVEQVAVLARENSAGFNELYAFIQAKPSFIPNAAKVFMKNQLPDYMLPTYYIVVPTIPMNVHGKLDHRSLWQHQQSMESIETHADQVQINLSALETKLVAAFQKVMCVDDSLNVNHNFFEIGINSLMLVELQSQLQAEAGIVVAVLDFFNYPSIRSLANYLETQSSTVAKVNYEERTTKQRQALKNMAQRRLKTKKN